MAFESEQLLTLIITESPLQLAWSFPPSPLTTALDINRLDALEAGCIVILPDATLNPTAQSIRFYNIGANAVDIHLFGDIFLLNLEPGEYYQFSLVDNTTQAGVWIAVPYVAGAVNISNFTIKSDTSESITVLNGDVTATGQIVTIQQPPALQAFVTPADTNLSFKGILAFDPNAGNPIYYSRVLTSGDGNIVITNGDGTAADPTFALNPDLTNLNSFSFGDTIYTAQGITSSGTDIIISTGGTSGVISLNGVQADSGGNLNIPGSLTASAFASPQVPIAWARITDTTTGSTNILTTQDSFNATITQAVAGIGGTYVLTMPTPATNTYFGVQCSCGTESITVPPLFGQIIYSTATINQFSFVVTDAGGTIVSEVPNSLTITVYSSGEGTGSGSSIYGPYANMYIIDNEAATTVSTVDTYVPVVGTTAAGLLRSFTMPEDNKLLYTGTKPVTVTVRFMASVFFLSDTPRFISMGVTKNDTLVLPRQCGAPVPVNETSFISVEVDVSLVENDYLRVVIGVDPNPTPPYDFAIYQMNVTVQSVS